MNRPMLIIIGLLVIGGIAVFALNGPSILDRIADARTCSQLAAVYDGESDMAQDATQREWNAKADELGC